MTDLSDLLEELSTPPRDWGADTHAVLGEGRRRVRRRRLRVGGVVAAAVVLGVVGAGLVRSAHEPAPAHGQGYSHLDTTPLTASEVVARCLPQVRDEGDEGDLSVPGSVHRAGRETQAPRPWHTGSSVTLRSSTGGLVGCRVPEKPETLGALSLTRDPARLRTMCGAKVGIDLGGWQEVAAAADGHVQGALFRSGNGYVVSCWAQDVRHFGLQGGASLSRASAHTFLRGDGGCLTVRRGGVHCLGIGRVRGPHVDRVVVELPSGVRVRRPAVDGFWVLAQPATRDELVRGPSQSFPARAVR